MHESHVKVVQMLSGASEIVEFAEQPVGVVRAAGENPALRHEVPSRLTNGKKHDCVERADRLMESFIGEGFVNGFLP